MARHNRDGQGTDQRGYEYQVNYQPDWLRLVKVTRALESGRQSTKTLFRNPSNRRQSRPGRRVKTRIVSVEQDLDFEVTVNDGGGRVRRVKVAYALPSKGGRGEEVVFTLEGGLAPSR